MISFIRNLSADQQVTALFLLVFGVLTLATGVLVVGFGNATRLLNYIVDHDKTYLATIRLGQRTTTDDADGELLPGEGTIAEFPSRQTVEDAIAHHFTGRIEQVPNSYSAIKING